MPSHELDQDAPLHIVIPVKTGIQILRDRTTNPNLDSRVCGNDERATMFSLFWTLRRNARTKRNFVFALAAIFLTFSFPAQAQQPARIPRIGILIPTSASFLSARVEAFRQRLRELGYVEGKNIVIEYRYAEGKPERLPDLAAELVRSQS